MMELLEYRGDEFEAQFLPQFGRCGWNYANVRDHVQPMYRDGRQVRPTPGEEFSPQLQAPDDFPGNVLLIQYQADFDVIPDELPPPTPAQMAALEFAVDREEPLLDEIADALGTRYRERGLHHEQSVLGDEFSKLDQLINGRRGVCSLIRFRAVCVSDREGPEGTALGFYGDDALDSEHGFGVVTLAGRVLDIGYSDIGWNVRA